MLSEITGSPLARTSSTAVGDITAHQRAGEHQHLHARQSPGRAHRCGQLLLADQGNRVHGDALAADVVAIGLRDRPHRHLAHLRAAAHDDDALAVDVLNDGVSLTAATPATARRPVSAPVNRSPLDSARADPELVEGSSGSVNSK